MWREWVCTHEYRCPWRQEEGVEFSGAWVVGSAAHESWLLSSALCKSSVCLAPTPSLSLKKKKKVCLASSRLHGEIIDRYLFVMIQVTVSSSFYLLLCVSFY